MFLLLHQQLKLRSFAIDTFPVSSETTIAIASDSFDIPIAALCLVPNSLAISLSPASGSIQAAALILPPLITTAPSCKGVFGTNIFTSICGEISASIETPVAIISFISISLSSTISAPVFSFDNSNAAIAIFYISSFVFVSISLSIPKNLVNLLLPSSSNDLLSSGWKSTTKNKTYVINDVNI